MVSGLQSPSHHLSPCGAPPRQATRHARVHAQETRESLGLRLEGAVVIVDEAHNLVDAVNAVHGAAASGRQLATARAALTAYHDRFRSRLAPGGTRFQLSLEPDVTFCMLQGHECKEL